MNNPYQISEPERKKLKNVIDEAHRQIMQEDSEYEKENNHLHVSQTDAYLISYEGGS